MTSAPLLEVNHLQKLFDSSRRAWRGPREKIHALEDVSFRMNPGEMVGLVGESGSGKSTLGRSILRLIEPTAGRIIFNGLDITRLNRTRLRPLRRDMQMIFQDPFGSLNPRMTVAGILTEPLRVHEKLSKQERLARAAELLLLVGLEPTYLARYPHEFSGGQRQRIGIARALALHPKLIVADEPVSALDVSVQAQCINLLQDLRTKLNLAMLFISHDLLVVEYICDRVIVMYLGRIMEIAPSKSLYRNPKHPYTEALLSAAPVPALTGKQKRIVLQGEIPSPANPPSGCVFRTRCPYAIKECSEQIPVLQEVGPGHFKACIRDVL
ncbi:MAG TPA: oligopeptide/dipeptide ABC transporter ATP-binding protein [Bryobacteraceae bacterium]|nr:oligopeptide/dipeptide ABC transporter ATP-binding protein [Bryobacteraceae bacterium]